MVTVVVAASLPGPMELVGIDPTPPVPSHASGLPPVALKATI
jgi:hypothetical protein